MTTSQLPGSAQRSRVQSSWGRRDPLPGNASTTGRRGGFHLGRALLTLGLLLGALIWVAPFLFVFLTSVKSPADINANPAWALPAIWEWGNYADAIDRGNLVTTGLNSALITVVKVPLGLAVSALAAYALARIRFRFNLVVTGIIALGAMIPVQIALGPLFALMLELDLLNSWLGLLFPYLAFGLPYQTFVLFGFFSAIPDDLEEAARIDGASTFRIFRSVILPLARAPLAALLILDFVATWNEYPMATTLLQRQDSWTVPLAIQSFNSQFSSDYGELNAFIVITIIPVLVVYLTFQRYFVNGALAGAVKG
ncbi:carbohydrate ABC transporter permease [Occultella gossypii]|uniref:Carbohydrate ABC transporter permease n=1 Tax=Occultella gossypii TaxID=2800820 RepID=A0ABS7SBZ5_9MICO|nr:carbohydrate ABC transporter permease [Occultella gossypii]MBZ2197865.1 carbohydrate ABC transporter permease [Occultella gossypii]